MGFPLLCAVLVLLGRVGAKRTVPRRGLVTWSGSYIFVNIEVGTPPQKFTARAESDKPGFIIMDEECQQTQVGPTCSHRYCHNDITQHVLNCSPLCAARDQRGLKRLCADNGFLSNASETFVDLGAECATRFHLPDRPSRQLYGKTASDWVAITTKEEDGLEIEKSRIKFIRGLLFDAEYLQRSSLILGLAPTTAYPGLIQQYYDSGIVGKARVGFHSGVSRRRLYSESGTAIGTFGNVDMADCAHWAAGKSTDGWAFQMSDVNFGGLAIRGANVGRIALDNDIMGIPAFLIDYFIEKGSLQYRDFLYIHYQWNRTVPLYLDFKLGGRQFRIPQWALLFDMRRDDLEWYPVAFFPKEPIRFNDEAQWSFGTQMLRVLCFGFDYRTNETLLGYRRHDHYFGG